MKPREKVELGESHFLLRSEAVRLAPGRISAEETAHETAEEKRRMERGRTRNERSISETIQASAIWVGREIEREGF